MNSVCKPSGKPSFDSRFLLLDTENLELIRHGVPNHCVLLESQEPCSHLLFKADERRPENVRRMPWAQTWKQHLIQAHENSTRLQSGKLCFRAVSRRKALALSSLMTEKGMASVPCSGSSLEVQERWSVLINVTSSSDTSLWRQTELSNWVNWPSD